MVLLKKILLFTTIFIYLILGLILHLITLVFRGLRFRIISYWTKIINRLLRKILRVKLTLKGENSYLKERGNFIICNHLGYLDGLILGSLFPVIFVSKTQVRSWPIFGLMTIIGGTIFIDRKQRFKSPEYIEEIANVLKKKTNVLIFPEGTSTDGSKLLKFQSVFFEAAIIAGADILPITLQYKKINDQEISYLNRDKVFWYGQIKFSKHLNKILEFKKIEAEVIIHPKIKIKKNLKDANFRKILSEQTKEVILKDCQFLTPTPF